MPSTADQRGPDFWILGGAGLFFGSYLALGYVRIWPDMVLGPKWSVKRVEKDYRRTIEGLSLGYFGVFSVAFVLQFNFTLVR